jgi:hypothetical protein
MLGGGGAGGVERVVLVLVSLSCLLGVKAMKSEKKGQNMTILGYSCSLQSSLYTKNHRFTFKSLIFCPKTIATLVSKR